MVTSRFKSSCPLDSRVCYFQAAVLLLVYGFTLLGCARTKSFKSLFGQFPEIMILLTNRAHLLPRVITAMIDTHHETASRLSAVYSAPSPMRSSVEFLSPTTLNLQSHGFLTPTQKHSPSSRFFKQSGSVVMFLVDWSMVLLQQHHLDNWLKI